MTNIIDDVIQKEKEKIYDIKDPCRLLEYINNNLPISEKAKKERGEVFTPLNTIDEMLDKLPIDVWYNPELKWLDPASGLGNFPVAIYKRLFQTLKNINFSKFPKYKSILDTDEKRRKHILENMLYMVEFDKGNVFFMKKILCGNKYNLNIFEGSFITHKSYDSSIKVFNGKFNNGKDIKLFDIIIGNPPYNDKNESPIYNIFIQNALKICNKYLLFIIPSRWFSGGKGLDNFRKMMLNRTDIEFINHFENASKIFGKNVDIKGGINYFLINKNYNGLCKLNGIKIKLNKYDILLKTNKYNNLIDKIIKYKSINELYLGRYFGIETNDKRLISKKINNNYIKCYVSKKKDFKLMYINKNLIKIKFFFYKIITPTASYINNSGFGNIFIGKPNEVHSGSYISFKVNSYQQAKSLLSYLKCKLPNFMLSLRKTTIIINKETLKWVPLPPLDRIWTDEKVYKYFKLTPDEIKNIKEKKLKGFHNN